jgi:BirA family transcriptional regulator, biotin operon repressor / biotin---[acetyl-CoA-carboxylase] ligase
MSDWKDAIKEIPVAAYQALDETDSTNDVALEWVRLGAVDRSLVIANRQLSGRGRMDRKWQTFPDDSLAFSYILRPTPREVPYVSYFSALGALAICEAILPYGIQAQIKWPNDVLLNRKKVAGILSEIAWEEETVAAIVIGIGVNIATHAIPEAEDQIYMASSISVELGKPVERIQFLAELLAALDAWRLSINSRTFFDEWNMHLAYKGEQVAIHQVNGEVITGTLIGINPFGAVLLRDTAGMVHSYLAGDVHLRPIN